MPRIKFYSATAIPAAGTTTTTPKVGIADASHLELFAKFVYGSGGTSVKAYVQTSLDEGATWIDIACFAFTTASATKMQHVGAAGNLADATVPTDAGLADDTTRPGVIGDRVRVKLVVVGTYASSTLTLYAVPKAGVDGVQSITSLVPGTGATALGKAEDTPHASGDTGVFIFGVHNEADTLFTDTAGDYSPVAVNRAGAVNIALLRNAAAVSSDNNAGFVYGAITNARNSGALAVHPMLYNGSGVDRSRNNESGTALASAARTATTNSADLTNFNGRGVIVYLNVTAVPGVDTVTLSIQEKDPVSGTYVTLLTAAARVATGMDRIVVYPGVTETANIDQSTPIGRTFRAVVTHSAGSSFTYSVGYAVIL